MGVHVGGRQVQMLIPFSLKGTRKYDGEILTFSVSCIVKKFGKHHIVAWVPVKRKRNVDPTLRTRRKLYPAFSLGLGNCSWNLLLK